MEKFTNVFGHVFSVSGTRGFCGEKYHYQHLHKMLFPRNFDFSGAVSIAKTITVSRRMPQTEDELGKGNGNIILDPETWLPKQGFPDCLKIGFRGFLTGTVCNSVGWAGPGLEALLLRLLMLKLLGLGQEKIILSLGATGATKKERLQEYREARDLIEEWLKVIDVPVTTQLTFACPNIGENFVEAVTTKEKIEAFKVLSTLGIHLGMKINVLQNIPEVLRIVEEVRCDWVEIPNTYPIKATRKKSPFRYAGGGISSRENFKMAIDWQRRARVCGLQKHTQVFCGGNFRKGDIFLVKEVGFDGFMISRASYLRPWRLKGMIEMAEIFA